MSFGDALSIAMSGLRANQASMALVSSNVANAETPGYVAKSSDQIATNSGASGVGVNVLGVNRQLDRLHPGAVAHRDVGRVLRLDSVPSYLQQLQSLYGDPNSTGTLENSFNDLTTAVQALGTSPDSHPRGSASSTPRRRWRSSSTRCRRASRPCAAPPRPASTTTSTTANALMKQIADINNQCGPIRRAAPRRTPRPRRCSISATSTSRSCRS